MSMRPPARRLAAGAIRRARTPSSASSFVPTYRPLLSAPQCRTIFGWGQPKPPSAPSSNPILEKYYESRQNRPSAQNQTRGDLAPTSIFEQDRKAREEETGLSAEQEKRRTRDPHAMGAKLDPDPRARRRWERKILIRDVRRRGRLSRTMQIKRSEREHLAKSPMIKTSVKKLNPLARQIAGKTVEDALIQMQFSKKKAAKDVKQLLEYASDQAVVARGMGLGEAENTKGEPVQIELKNGKRHVVKDRTKMYISQAWVGRGTYGREPDYRARGRMNIMRNPKTSISVLLKEEATRVREAQERQYKRDNRKLWTHLPDRPIYGQQQYYSW